MRRKDWSIYRVRLLDGRSESVADIHDDEKLKRLNTFRNCLFLRDFRMTLFRRVGAETESGAPIGWLEVFWATPENDPGVEALTRKYRAWAAALAAAITILFAAFYRVLILPLRRVSGAIDRSARFKPELLPRPVTALERDYNNLARDALLTRMQSEIHEWIGGGQTLDQADLYARLPQWIAGVFGFPAVSIREMRVETEQGARTLRHHVAAPAKWGEPELGALERFEKTCAMRAAGELASDWDGGAQSLRFAGQIIRSDSANSQCDVLTIAFDPRASRFNPAWPPQTAERVAEEIRMALQTLQSHHASVFQQKSEASINLAENLGHDLTNIIATAKLDLATLEQILDADLRRVAESPQLAGLLREAAKHLLANTRFLQETVNIYRAFTYLKKPRYETVDLNVLARETGDLFLSSISGILDLAFELDPSPCPSVAEPRLIKMSLFNLLTNASDAVKAAQSVRGGAGRVAVRTRCDAERGEIMIAVCDNGLGIRNAKGDPATAQDIARLFHSGYSSKREGGGGLGLSWVWRIICEFHKGRLTAENLESGGAEFRMFLAAAGPPSGNSGDTQE